jgi:hypothetical protein
MADTPQPPPPLGAPGSPVTPMKKSTGKVQPKKETVRITLPPKPSAAPTIKLPTLPPAGPTGAPGTPPPPKPAGAAAPVAAPRTTTAAPVASAAPQTQAARPAPAPRPPAAAQTASPFDTILAIAACVAALAAVGTTVWMMMMLNDAIAN